MPFSTAYLSAPLSWPAAFSLCGEAMAVLAVPLAIMDFAAIRKPGNEMLRTRDPSSKNTM